MLWTKHPISIHIAAIATIIMLISASRVAAKPSRNLIMIYPKAAIRLIMRAINTIALHMFWRLCSESMRCQVSWNAAAEPLRSSNNF